MAGVGWVWESEVGGEARAMLRGCLHRLRGKRRGCDFGYLCMLQCHPVSLLPVSLSLSLPLSLSPPPLSLSRVFRVNHVIRTIDRGEIR